MPVNKDIWTFWEPESSMHPYLRLCMETWKKFLPDFKINMLNYSNIDMYLGRNFFDKSLYKNYTIAQQADAVRAALLEKYGGIWLDTDTIITSGEFRKLLEINSDFIMFNRHIGFIISKQHSKAAQVWVKGLHKNLLLRKFLMPDKIAREILRIAAKPLLEKFKSYTYLGCDIFDSFLNKADFKEFCSLDKEEYYALPEFNYNSANWKIDLENYHIIFRKFYFENDLSDYILKHEKGIVMLHNTNVPAQYKEMSEQEFLNQNNTLAVLFKKIL